MSPRGRQAIRYTRRGRSIATEIELSTIRSIQVVSIVCASCRPLQDTSKSQPSSQRGKLCGSKPLRPCSLLRSPSVRGYPASSGYRYCVGCNCPRSVQTTARNVAIGGRWTALYGCILVRCKCLNPEASGIIFVTSRKWSAGVWWYQKFSYICRASEAVVSARGLRYVAQVDIFALGENQSGEI